MTAHPVRIFLLGLVNFSILLYALHRLLGSATNQFFFSRRARIRKEMLASVMDLRKSRAMSAQSRANYDSLPKDMAARRAAVLAQCRVECSLIEDDARRRAEYMIESSKRQAGEEQAKAGRRLRTRLVSRAFEIANEKLKRASAATPMRRYLEQGLEALSRAMT
ncbi:MAG: hypothetical protein WC956_03820 [bacterium]